MTQSASCIHLVSLEAGSYIDEFDLSEKLLTSDELSPKWNRIVDAEAALRAHCETILLLVEADVANFVGATWCSRCHFFYCLVVLLF